ncbi:hypothetical protein JTE90_000941 [Oedothorax gibbosus]|uniref:Protein FAM195A n=1 Tax=Oedothorax gibbosus TaxID=931172 RepID=A0AAV6U7F9_9ARAC|nr:hypothetical protein JTE90_000941 [Oedothorax gibbosus]
MYTVSNRPYKLLANTRRGIAQKVDPLETSSGIREFVKCGTNVNMSMPRPVFHQVNGRKPQSPKAPQDIYPPQYNELIKYINDSWSGTQKEYELSKHSPDNKVPKVVYYQDDSDKSHLANFERFDLESFWGERFLKKIQQST